MMCSNDLSRTLLQHCYRTNLKALGNYEEAVKRFVQLTGLSCDPHVLAFVWKCTYCAKIEQFMHHEELRNCFT
jgi:hypothetical protein